MQLSQYYSGSHSVLCVSTLLLPRICALLISLICRFVVRPPLFVGFCRHLHLIIGLAVMSGVLSVSSLFVMWDPMKKKN